MLVDRGIYKSPADVIAAAIDLLICHQMKEDSVKQREEYGEDETLLGQALIDGLSDAVISERAFKVEEDETDDWH